MLYACDLSWWMHNPASMQQFAGLKITQDPATKAHPVFNKVLHWVKCNHGVDTLQVGTYGQVGWGGNSGFQAINLAVQFGAKLLVLVGYDMRVDRGLHWHPDHPQGMNNPTARNVARWCRVTDNASVLLNALGVKVVNLSPHSALTAYPKMSLTEALTLIGEHDEVRSSEYGVRLTDGQRDGVLNSGCYGEQHPQANLQRHGVG